MSPMRLRLVTVIATARGLGSRAGTRSRSGDGTRRPNAVCGPAMLHGRCAVEKPRTTRRAARHLTDTSRGCAAATIQRAHLGERFHMPTARPPPVG